MTRRPPTIIERASGSIAYLDAPLHDVVEKLKTAHARGREATFWPDTRRIDPAAVKAIRQADKRLEAAEFLHATRKKKDRK